MKLSLSLAEKLLSLANGEKIPASKLKHSVVDDLLAEGIINDARQGRTKSILHLPNAKQLDAYLKNRFGINDLSAYIDFYKNEDAGRAEAVLVSSDSKVKSVRSFKGFLVNTYAPVEASLHGKPITIQPATGTFTFICDFENFLPAEDVTIVGIENSESFRYVEKQKHLFSNLKPLFVCRYPYSTDLIVWLKTIHNPYVHFGDFDFAGIGIYLNEYKRYLNDKSSFYIPANIEALIKNYGNKNRYDQQKINFNIEKLREENLLQLISLLHKYKKGLDQEVLMNFS